MSEVPTVYRTGIVLYSGVRTDCRNAGRRAASRQRSVLRSHSQSTLRECILTKANTSIDCDATSAKEEEVCRIQPRTAKISPRAPAQIITTVRLKA